MSNFSVGMRPQSRTISSPSKTHIELLDRVFAKTCQYFEIGPSLLKGKARHRPIVFYRQCAMKFMYEQIGIPFRINQTYIAKKYFGRDHTTLVHARHIIEDYRETGDHYWNEYISYASYMIVNFPRIIHKINPEDYPTLHPIINK